MHTIPFTSLFGKNEIQFGRNEIEFDKNEIQFGTNENQCGTNEIQIDINETISCFLLFSYFDNMHVYSFII